MSTDVVFTAGVWDLFHIGHLNFLRGSARLGRRLIVAVSTDCLVEKYKGVKPVIPFKERFAIIKELRCVTLAIKQEKLIDVEHLKRYKPSVITLGSDWENKSIPNLKRWKGEVIYLPYTEGISTSILREKLFLGI